MPKVRDILYGSGLGIAVIIMKTFLQCQETDQGESREERG